MLWIHRYTPGLLHWWLTQIVYSSSSVLDKNIKSFSSKDLEVVTNNLGYQLPNKVLMYNKIVTFSYYILKPLGNDGEEKLTSSSDFCNITHLDSPFSQHNYLFPDKEGNAHNSEPS